ncbi:MAG TPA: Fe-S cluster assembly protein SufD [Thermoanaerobaculia bacterium]|nr:Fe-S cluster assembly protein SufD [Thermoanaerobaculia bacterium]
MTRAARPLALHEGVAALAAQASDLTASRPGPPWLQKLRRSGLAAFERLGFPSTYDEEWRFTNLAPLTRTGFALPADEVSLAERTAALEMEARLGTIGFSASEPRLAFVNGRHLRRNVGVLPPGVFFEWMGTVLRESPELVEKALVASAAAEGPARGSFAALGDAFLDEGVVLRVAAGVRLEEPLFILHVSTPPGSSEAPRMVHTRNLFAFEENSSATVIEAYLGAGGPSFMNARTDVSLARDARVNHVTLQLEGPEAFHVGHLSVAHSPGATSASHVFSFGGKLVRNEVAMDLAGEGAGTELYGLFCANSGQHVDCHTLIDHVAPRANSIELYKGVLDGTGRGVFDGKIVVHPGAVRTDARQTNRNLILSDSALVDSKPQLEIHNNDVRCSHGSTTGRLDADAVFYLRSRGLSPEAARALLTYAFGSEMIEKVASADVKAFLEGHLRAWLPANLAAPENR